MRVISGFKYLHAPPDLYVVWEDEGPYRDKVVLFNDIARREGEDGVMVPPTNWEFVTL